MLTFPGDSGLMFSLGQPTISGERTRPRVPRVAPRDPPPWLAVLFVRPPFGLAPVFVSISTLTLLISLLGQLS